MVFQEEADRLGLSGEYITAPHYSDKA